MSVCVFDRFQRDGIAFAVRHGGRALIADDMGLGKTVQVAYSYHSSCAKTDLACFSVCLNLLSASTCNNPPIQYTILEAVLQIHTGRTGSHLFVPLSSKCMACPITVWGTP